MVRAAQSGEGSVAQTSLRKREDGAETEPKKIRPLYY